MTQNINKFKRLNLYRIFKLNKFLNSDINTITF
jgi:hypothetical protein